MHEVCILTDKEEKIENFRIDNSKVVLESLVSQVRCLALFNIIIRFVFSKKMVLRNGISITCGEKVRKYICWHCSKMLNDT
jgi:hypothetical protein